MKILFKQIHVFLFGCFASLPAMAYHTFYSNSAEECYVDTSPDDSDDYFWYCGHQTQSCRSNGENKDDGHTFLYHGDYFLWPDKKATKTNEKVGLWSDASEQKYWCCGGTSSKSGRFYKSDSWITKSETVTETLPNGKCTWIRKTNICGQIDNPDDKCTEATGECTTGFISHNGKCVAACADGQAFASATSSACVECASSSTQGIRKNVCIKCEANQFFDKTTLSCIARSSKLQVSVQAFNDCWMCVTPGAMYNCMKTISTSGTLSDNLQQVCSVDGKSSDASVFRLPEIKFVSAATLNIRQMPSLADFQGATTVSQIPRR